MCQAFAVFFMLNVIQSSQHPFEVVYFCFLFSDGKQKLGEIGQLAPDLTANTVAIELRLELSPLSLTVYSQLTAAKFSFHAGS